MESNPRPQSEPYRVSFTAAATRQTSVGQRALSAFGLSRPVIPSGFDSSIWVLSGRCFESYHVDDAKPSRSLTL
jgi:hypothetical protein